MILLATGPSTEALELKGVGATIGGSWMGQKHEFTEVYEFPSPADDDIAGVVLGAFLSAAMEHQFSACLKLCTFERDSSRPLATDEIGMPVGERTEVYAAHYLSVPVTLRFELEANAVGPYYFAGAGAEILISRGDSGFFDSFNTVTLSGHVGIGVVWRRIGLDIRYLRDLRDAADPSGPLESVTNDGFLAALTYAI
jgi:hypothetical protein